MTGFDDKIVKKQNKTNKQKSKLILTNNINKKNTKKTRNNTIKGNKQY